MTDTPTVGIVVSITTIGTIIAFLTFWTKFTDRITKVESKADTALQEAAEAKNENRNLREAFDEMTRDLHDQLERMRREAGESGAAIRQHVTEVAFFGRDNYALKDDIAAATIKSDAWQLRMDTKLDGLTKDMNTKLDGIAKDIRDGR